MTRPKKITVCAREGEDLNGLGMMMLQYLEQNLSDSEHKIKEGLRIRGAFAVEMEGGVASTITFQGDRILIQNDVASGADLYLKGSYMVMTKVLTGQVNPFVELLRRNITPAAFPRRPLQSIRVLRFLKIPRELMGGREKSGNRALHIVSWALGSVALIALIYMLFVE